MKYRLLVVFPIILACNNLFSSHSINLKSYREPPPLGGLHRSSLNHILEIQDDTQTNQFHYKEKRSDGGNVYDHLDGLFNPEYPDKVSNIRNLQYDENFIDDAATDHFMNNCLNDESNPSFIECSNLYMDEQNKYSDIFQLTQVNQ